MLHFRTRLRPASVHQTEPVTPVTAPLLTVMLTEGEVTEAAATATPELGPPLVKVTEADDVSVAVRE